MAPATGPQGRPVVEVGEGVPQVELRTLEQAESLARQPGVRLLPPLTVETVLERQCDVVKWLTGAGLDMPPARA